MTPEHSSRFHLAWLIWCVNQGYRKPEDRAILTNWLLEDPSTLHPDDVIERDDLLTMADEVATDLLAALDAERQRADVAEAAFNEAAQGCGGRCYDALINYRAAQRSTREPT